MPSSVQTPIRSDPPPMCAGSWNGICRLAERSDVYLLESTFRNTISRSSTRKDTDLPADGVLMQLGRAYRMAGKKAEALQTFTRVTEEFPQSIYVGEARREADALKASM